MVSLRHLHRSFNRLWSPEKSDSELRSLSLCSRLPYGSPPLAFTSKALLPTMLLMCSDTRDAGRGCAFSMRHDRNASYSHKLAPTNSASDINCASDTELAGSSFMGKWQQGQQNFISEANLYFVSSCPCLDLSPRPNYSHSMKDKLQFFCLKI